jgi:hypothetical protein
MQGNCAEVLLPEEQKWEARKERMAQMEAVLMSAINHPNIVNTYKVGGLHVNVWLCVWLCFNVRRCS